MAPWLLPTLAVWARAILSGLIVFVSAEAMARRGGARIVSQRDAVTGETHPTLVRPGRWFGQKTLHAEAGSTIEDRGHYFLVVRSPYGGRTPESLVFDKSGREIFRGPKPTGEIDGGLIVTGRKTWTMVRLIDPRTGRVEQAPVFDGRLLRWGGKTYDRDSLQRLDAPLETLLDGHNWTSLGRVDERGIVDRVGPYAIVKTGGRVPGYKVVEGGRDRAFLHVWRQPPRILGGRYAVDGTSTYDLRTGLHLDRRQVKYRGLKYDLIEDHDGAWHVFNPAGERLADADAQALLARSGF